MINKEILKYDRAQLTEWLRNEAGSSNMDYFGGKKSGGLKLQQVPEEYSQLLLFLKDRGVDTYLGLGIGNGGSFALECFFLGKGLKKAVAVDNLAYGAQIGQNEEEVMNYLAEADNENVYFVKATTDQYFAKFTDKFDCIFIDADHSYEGAKRDFDNSLQRVNKGGFIIFHDINSAACPGIQRLWKEASKDRGTWEFVHGNNCGIGIIQVL